MVRNVLGAASVVAAAAVGCNNDWRTDMWDQPAIRAEQQPRPQPAHSVALGAAVRIEDRDDALDLKNPVPADRSSIERGEYLFAGRCTCCHGKNGHGNGPVSKFFPPAPDLAYPVIQARPDGYIFATITLGGRAMPRMGIGLTPHDRWDLVNYVRTITLADGGKP